MAGHVINLLVIIAAGVIVADMVANAAGTSALFNGLGSIWKVGVNGMLGKQTP